MDAMRRFVPETVLTGARRVAIDGRLCHAARYGLTPCDLVALRDMTS